MTNNPKKIWLLASPHTGDNTQLMALVESLGWPFEVKRLAYRPWHTVARLALGGTLTGLQPEALAQITKPYPDLVIAAGRPTEAVALWLKANANVKLVCVGTPWAALDNFDLVITTPQYRLPHLANILHNELPMHKVVLEKLNVAAELWRSKLAHLPQPWTAVLVGGNSGPYTFGLAAAQRLAAQANALQGSLLVTTSARTSTAVATALENSISAPHYFHHWSPDKAENPLFGFLALADQFIVTADSVSMLAETCATGKPVLLFDTENGPFSMRDSGGPIHWRGRNLSATAFRFAMRVGPPNWSRDLRVVHRQLIASGRATWLGEPITAKPQAHSADDLARASTRVRQLFNL
jgi:uncharacterized protein